jgi:hypothetical protein
MFSNKISKSLTRRVMLAPCLLYIIGLGLSQPKAGAELFSETAIGETIQGTLDDRDFPYNGHFFDVYTFVGVKGQEIFLNLSAFDFDPILWLVNGQGQFIAYDDDTGDAMGALISRFSLPESGIYIPAVGSKNAGEFGDYTLSLNDAPWVNYSGGIPEEIFIGDQISGNLTNSSSQWSTGHYFNAYRFEASPGQAISIAMRSEQINAYLWLLDQNGRVITVNDDKRDQTASEIIFFPHISGTYFIAASSSEPAEKGEYELILTTTYQPTQQAKELTETVSDKLEASDFQLSTGQYLDVYTFQGQMGESVTIGLSASEFDSYLRILDSAGNVLTEDDDSGGGKDALIEDFVLPNTGHYSVWVSSVFAGGTDNYVLSLNEPRQSSRIRTEENIKLVLNKRGEKLVRGKGEPFANASRCVGSLDTYTAKVKICNTQNESRSGSITLSGSSDIVISPESMSFTINPNSCVTKSPFYITSASATVGVKTINATALLGEEIGRDSENLHVVTVEVFRDANFTQPLTDWPASGGNPRSPRYLFTSDDPIYVQVTGLGSDPNEQETLSDAIQVTSDSDATGIHLTLTETGPNTGVFRNTGDLLYLSRESSQGKIKVVDEEVLSFKPSQNQNCFDVMVDRAEFSSTGIHRFYGTEMGDRAIVRAEALTNTKFFDAGDIDFPSVGAGEPMRTFIKNVGDNQAGDGEADIMQVSSHGHSNGNLQDDGGNDFIVPAVDILNSSDWNDDIEWVVLAACSTLNEPGGGLVAWTSALNGNPRGLHGVLGAHYGVSVVLIDQIQGFWERMRQGYTIKDAYAAAMELDGPEPEPWAVLNREVNGSDKLKEITPDILEPSSLRSDSSSIDYSYLDITTVICDEVDTCDDQEIKETIDDGNGLVRIELPMLSESLRSLPIQQKMIPVNFETRLPFARKVSKNRDGRTVYEGEYSFDVTSSLSEEGAISLARDLVQQYLPDLISKIKLKKVNVRKSGTVNAQGQEVNTRVNGYIVHFEVFSGALPVWGDHIRVSIFGDQFGAASLLYHTSVPTNTLQEQKNPLEVLEALAISLNDIKQDLAIEGKYEILEAELLYVEESAIKDHGEGFVPAWHLIFNSDFQGNGSSRRLYHVWLDAITGEYISKTSYPHRRNRR